MSGSAPFWRRGHWIFDLDGTLTRPVHDFEALRRTLGFPSGAPILEAIAARPPAEAARLHAQVEAWEMEAVAHAEAAAGAHALLGALTAAGHRLGILTRNTAAIAVRTLEAAGLAGFFELDCVLGRDGAAPKPSPAGVRLLLARWQAAATDAVVVGDFRYDLEAGRAAGAATIWVDHDRDGRFADLADLTVPDLTALCP